MRLPLMSQIVNDMVCVRLLCYSFISCFFIAPTDQSMTDKGKEKGIFSTLTARNKLLNHLQRISLSEDKQGEQFGPAVVKADMRISLKRPSIL